MNTGTIGWTDLTVGNAATIRDFYQAVVGWNSDDVDMGDYSDYVMLAPKDGTPVAGVCHARGSNADLPPVWLVYFVVADVAESSARCEDLGGEILVTPRGLSGGRFCVVKDPAGAICALYQVPPEGAAGGGPEPV